MDYRGSSQNEVIKHVGNQYRYKAVSSTYSVVYRGSGQNEVITHVGTVLSRFLAHAPIAEKPCFENQLKMQVHLYYIYYG